MPARRISKAIHIGTVQVGGGAPISVQSMTKTDTRDVKATIRQIKELADCGCEIVRLAVPDSEAADALSVIKQNAPIPLVADIHFDHRLALKALAAGVDGLRLNPGNISEREKISEVVVAAKERQVPIRIGVNAGSLPQATSSKQTIPELMVAVAMRHIKLLEDHDFDLIKVSLKAFDVLTTIAAYETIATKIPYPLHLGITEAGTPRSGIIRSAAGIGTLLYIGLGDTLRVSLTASPHEEVSVGYEILKSMELRQRGPVLVSCPTCGRCEVDIIPLAEKVSQALQTISKPIRVAVMGCVVNGPGEAKDADIGIACGKGKAILFKKGEQVAIVPEEDILENLLQGIETL
ncbi:MAG: flavodoxin-dependent (E)-4-hydroxy-3-methylbut-2-enyl-diphosphate synthase [Dehalococcoidia bacterium]|nr:flavodoxin-dependent (E)-4-hydroxy-3-methylbut-2-enyl-diphosphate synthase [Dehalococcoidia bacterium]